MILSSPNFLAPNNTYTFAIPAFRTVKGTRGFYVAFYNRISSIKTDHSAGGV